jgi:hypothetical protein
MLQDEGARIVGQKRLDPANGLLENELRRRKKLDVGVTRDSRQLI